MTNFIHAHLPPLETFTKSGDIFGSDLREWGKDAAVETSRES